MMDKLGKKMKDKLSNKATGKKSLLDKLGLGIKETFGIK